MIAMWIVITVSMLGGYALYSSVHEENCDEAYEKFDACKERYDYDACKDLYVPTSCEDRE